MKKVYDKPKEWVSDTIYQEGKHRGWFTWDKQDELCLQMAFHLYVQYDEDEQTPELFEELIMETTELLSVFYKVKYNPLTRKAR